MSPLLKGKSQAVKEKNFDEFRHGAKFAQTEKKFGKKKAEAQIVAAVLSTARKSGSKRKRSAK